MQSLQGQLVENSAAKDSLEAQLLELDAALLTAKEELNEARQEASTVGPLRDELACAQETLAKHTEEAEERFAQKEADAAAVHTELTEAGLRDSAEITALKCSRDEALEQVRLLTEQHLKEQKETARKQVCR